MNARYTLTLPPYWRSFIEKQIKGGRYPDASEVIQAGLAALEREEESFNLFLKDAAHPAAVDPRQSRKAPRE